MHHQFRCFLELLHTATLIHDDVVDETRERRGVPSLNAIFDNRVAVLTGDYILSTALIRSIQTGDLRIIGIISNLGRDLSEGEIKQMETADESILDESCYLQVIYKKTATLLSACTAIGAISAGADKQAIEAMKNSAKTSATLSRFETTYLIIIRNRTSVNRQETISEREK